MNSSQQTKKIHDLLLKADRLMCEALQLNAGKNSLFADKIVEAQFAMDDAITYLVGPQKKKSEKNLKKGLTNDKKSV